jgi:hypothetical protein
VSRFDSEAAQRLGSDPRRKAPRVRCWQQRDLARTEVHPTRETVESRSRDNCREQGQPPRFQDREFGAMNPFGVPPSGGPGRVNAELQTTGSSVGGSGNPGFKSSSLFKLEVRRMACSLPARPAGAGRGGGPGETCEPLPGHTSGSDTPAVRSERHGVPPLGGPCG